MISRSTQVFEAGALWVFGVLPLAPVTPDGLAVLPAFVDGPIAKIEIRVPGQPKGVMLRDVPVTAEPIVVDVSGQTPSR